MQRWYKFCKSIAIGLLLLGVFSCVCREKYPLEWPPLISMENEKCPDISGIFVDQGERSDKTEASLSEVFYKRGTGKYEKIEKVVYATHVQIIRLYDATLEISFWNNDKLAEKNIYSKKKEEYSCTPKGIRISFGPSQVFGPLGMGMDWRTLYLTKNTDGELVIEYTSSEIGLVAIIPVVASASDYIRFRQKQQ